MTALGITLVVSAVVLLALAALLFAGAFRIPTTNFVREAMATRWLLWVAAALLLAGPALVILDYVGALR